MTQRFFHIKHYEMNCINEGFLEANGFEAGVYETLADGSDNLVCVCTTAEVAMLVCSSLNDVEDY